MSFPEQENQAHRQKSSELKSSEMVFPSNVKTQDTKAEEKPPKKPKHKVPLTAAGVALGQRRGGCGGGFEVHQHPVTYCDGTGLAKEFVRVFLYEVMEKHQFFCQLNTSGQSERGLEKNFQTQSISEGGEYIKNKEQR